MFKISEGRILQEQEHTPSDPKLTLVRYPANVLGPKYSISNAQRFSNLEAQKKMQHTFFTPENYNKSSYIFGSDSRFKYKKDKEILRTKAPGPGTYSSLSAFKSAEKIKNGNLISD